MNASRYRLSMLRNQRGVMLPLLGIVLSGVMAMAAVGAGFGRMTLASSEAQNAADAAALAGAMAVFKGNSPYVDALVVSNGNDVENRSAFGMLSTLVVGSYDYDSRSFAENSIPQNAVMARMETTVSNPFGALIGKPTNAVEKIAYASLTGLRGGRPTLPIVIGECNFQEDCFSQSCMPRLTQVPDPDDNSGWTAFFVNSNVPNVESYVPAPCGAGNVQELWVGDIINVSNGQSTPLLRAIDCLIDEGNYRHLIPIVPCGGHYNQTKEVVGFATIDLESVSVSGGSKGIALQAIFKTDAIGAIGGSMFGTGNIALVPVNPSSDDD
jgi:hypothetical protein